MNEKVVIKKILEQYRTIAIVGLSRDSTKESYIVAEYLKCNSYDILPINPNADKILGKPCYKSLLDMPDEVQNTIEIVDIFRPSPEVLPIVDQVIQLKKSHGRPNAIWMQLGIINEEAAKLASENGIIVIMNKCMKIEHRRLRLMIEDEIAK